MERTDSEKQILELNFRNGFIDERREASPFDSEKMLQLLPETVVDKRTLQLLEIHELFGALDHTVTRVGSARLFHSLVNPSESIELIHAKQDSYAELSGNERLKQGIREFLERFKTGEKHLFRLINAHLNPVASYGDYRQAMTAIRTMLAEARKIAQPETVYLDSLLKNILGFAGADVHALTTGPVHRTFSGVLTRAEKKWFAPSWRFRPSHFSKGSLVPALPGLFFGVAWQTGAWLDPAIAQTMFYMTSWLNVFGFLHGGVVKPFIDYYTAVLPVRQRLIDSNHFASSLEAVAAIDELLSFVTYGERFPHPTVLPEVTNQGRHYFIADELRNPIHGKSNVRYVPNDVRLDAERLTFITGPNSGGKTTICKTIAQNQLLGQIGAPVAARRARMNMADMITYQAPAFDTLNDTEGRFGTELKVTRDVFYRVTPKSLTILDEIAEGTTSHEKLELSVDILHGFAAIGNTTLMVTHSHEMVEHFQKQGKGQYLQVEFDGEQPTHRIGEGISTDSHALRVAEKIGFSPEDIRKYLLEKGYLQEG